MTQSASLVARAAVDKRFRAVSLKHPVNAMLYKLAIEREKLCSGDQDFAAGMYVPIPDAARLMEMKSKMSLLPMDTIKERMKLPAVPGIVFRLQKALVEEAPTKQLAEIIRHDPKLTAAIMGLVNSPLYAQPYEVETLSRAITVIGTKEISSLALGTRLLAMFEDTPPEGMSLTAFWKHSIACAIFANDIAVILGRPEPDKYLVAGLLHDLGHVMLFSCYPEMAKVALALQQEKGMPLNDAERLVFDVDHCMVGGLFFSEWDLPIGVVKSALHHHDPSRCIGKEVPEVVYVANQIATALGLDFQGTYTMDPGEELWEHLNIGESELQSLIEDVDKRLWALLCFIFPTSKGCRRQTRNESR